MNFIRQAWYVAAFGDEVTSRDLFPRTLLSEPVLLFRNRDGTVAALADRCPHRFAPLHRGQWDGETIQCAYHGLVFSSRGECIRSPQGDPPSGAKVATYPVVERDGLVWIWMGRPADADAETIPNYGFLSRAKPTARIGGYIPAFGHYELMSDNIMDLSHVDFLHQTSLGSGAIASTRPDVVQSGKSVTIRWSKSAHRAPPIYDPYLPTPGMLVDQVIEVVWQPPALMFLTNSLQPVGEPASACLLSTNVHLMTPETPTSTHYFYAGTRNYNEDDAEANRQRDQAIRAAFRDEDKPMIEAVQRSMGAETDILSLRPISLPSDAGAFRARRIVREMLQAERSAVLS